MVVVQAGEECGANLVAVSVFAQIGAKYFKSAQIQKVKLKIVRIWVVRYLDCRCG